MEPQTPDEVRAYINVKRLKRAIRESSARCRDIKLRMKRSDQVYSSLDADDHENMRLLSDQKSLLADELANWRKRNRQLTSFMAWLNGNVHGLQAYSIRSTRVALTREFHDDIVGKLAEIARD